MKVAERIDHLELSKKNIFPFLELKLFEIQNVKKKIDGYLIWVQYLLFYAKILFMMDTGLDRGTKYLLNHSLLHKSFCELGESIRSSIASFYFKFKGTELRKS